MSIATNTPPISITTTGTGTVATNTTITSTLPHTTLFLDQPTLPEIDEHNTHAHHHHNHNNHHQTPHHHELIQADQTKGSETDGDTYQMSTMQPVSNSDIQMESYIIETNSHPNNTAGISAIAASSSATIEQNNFQNIDLQSSQPDIQLKIECNLPKQEQEEPQPHSPATRFKWTNEKTQVAMNLVKYGCKPKLVSVAVGCSLRTAQKFVETVTPKIEGETFKTYEIKRRGRKSKDVNQRLNAIREVLSRDSNKTQVEIAADLKVSNTTVCRDLKRIGASWKDKKNGSNNCTNSSCTTNGNSDQTTANQTTPPNVTRKTRQSNARGRNKTN